MIDEAKVRVPCRRPRRRMRRVVVFLFLAFVASPLDRAQALYWAPDAAATRWASPENPEGAKGGAALTGGSRKGRPALLLKSGQTAVLAEARGASGVVRRLWLTLSQRDPETLRGLRLEMFWDQAKAPAVSAPLGDFFGVGLGQMARIDSALFADPEGRSFECFIPMPFRSGMRITLTNETPADVRQVFYDVDYTVDDSLDAKDLYFHAWFNRENPTQLGQDYTILPPVTGRGRFLGANVGVRINRKEYLGTWWGEGEVKVYLDGDRDHPTLSGTGAEDYAGSGWGLHEFSNLYTGCPIAQENRVCFYRWHVPDPVYFHSSVSVRWQQIGLWKPALLPQLEAAGTRVALGTPPVDVNASDPKLPTWGLMERRDDVSSCAYFYLDRPEAELPHLPAVGDRQRDLND